MKQLATISYTFWVKSLAIILAFFFLALFGYANLFLLSHIKSLTIPGVCIPFILFLFFLTTILSWQGFKLLSISLFVPVACTFSILSSWATYSSIYLLFVPAQVILCLLLFHLDQRKRAEIIVHDVEIEKAINEKNDLEVSFKNEGTSISVYFEKYASYYNLRNLASDFSTTLSLKELTQMIVLKTMKLIPHIQSCLLFLSDPMTGNLSLVASHSSDESVKIKQKTGDLFDFWVVRNRQSLIVADTQKDFRFDLAKQKADEQVRCVLTSPLIHERKVVGTLRCNSPNPSTFNTDDLRLLDAIATLASSAISNSILFQKTEELAIRDSLTGLFVHRYFIERLTEEHGRSLLTHAPLTLLMCDLDHFKVCNDRFGHGVGDYVLKQISEAIAKSAVGGIVARYGGEEFSVLLPNQSLEQGLALAEHLRKIISDLSISIRREVIPITMSIGVASMPNDTLDSEELIRISDRRLYQAKKLGRNQVCGTN